MYYSYYLHLLLAEQTKENQKKQKMNKTMNKRVTERYKIKMKDVRVQLQKQSTCSNAEKKLSEVNESHTHW